MGRRGNAVRVRLGGVFRFFMFKEGENYLNMKTGRKRLRGLNSGTVSESFVC